MLSETVAMDRLQAGLKTVSSHERLHQVQLLAFLAPAGVPKKVGALLVVYFCQYHTTTPSAK